MWINYLFMQNTSKQLIKKKIITTKNNVYQVYDRFGGLWLKNVFETGYRL